MEDVERKIKYGHINQMIDSLQKLLTGWDKNKKDL
jgi:hypothetical protein